ncbi:MAG TPA: cytochrome C554 [Planctomycetaceae bacterium]|nr:cytochrome C554 [Planctomycetaceae bacterium]
MRKILLAVLACISLSASFGASISGPVVDDPRDNSLPVHLDPHQVVGYESCEKCHAAEIRVWKQTPHHSTFKTLHRNPAARKIASAMGIDSFKEDSECIKCHYTMKHTDHGLSAISGISCESCHGAARDWINVHNDYGGEHVTRLTESTEHRIQRLRNSIAGGMRNPVNVYLVARSCYRCHTVPSEKLVNVGGHNAGSLDFELVSWSQGMIRHNFVRSDGQTNDPSDRGRLRVMFVAGMIADLEFSVRASASATAKGTTFSDTSYERAKRAVKRVLAVRKKIGSPILDEVIEAIQGIRLGPTHREALLEAADAISAAGVKFAATVTPEQLEAIDGFIPPESKWR